MKPSAKFLYDYYLRKISTQKLGVICRKYNTLISTLSICRYSIIEEIEDKVIIQVLSPKINTFYYITPSINTLIVEAVTIDEGLGTISDRWEFSEVKYNQNDMIKIIYKYVSETFNKFALLQNIEDLKNEIPDF